MNWLVLLFKGWKYGAAAAAVLIAALSAAHYTDIKWEKKWADEQAMLTRNAYEALRVAAQLKDQAQERANNISVEYTDAVKQINSLAADNERLLAANGGLREKALRAAGDSTACATAAGDTAKPAAEPGQLSVETSRALLGMSSEADELYEYARACHAWAKSVKNERGKNGF